MKNLAFLLFLCALSFNSMAQSEMASSGRRGVWFCPNLNIGAAQLLNTKINIDGFTLDPSTKSFYSGSLNLGYMINDRWGIFSGIGLDRFSYETKDVEVNGNVSLEGHNTYLKIPVYLRFISSHAQKIGFFIDIGIKNDLLMGCETISGIQVYVPDIEFKSDKKGNDLSIYRFYAFAPFLNFGINIPIQPNTELNVGPEIAYYTTNLFNQQRNYDGTQTEGYYFSYGLKLGIRFKWM